MPGPRFTLLAGRRIAPLLAAGLLACAVVASRPRVSPLGSSQGELLVFVDPWPVEAARLSVVVASIAAVAHDGTLVPLTLVRPTLDTATTDRPRPLAEGRLPEGTYDGLAVTVERARLRGAQGENDLLVAAEPHRLPLTFTARGGDGAVLTMTLRAPDAVLDGFRFTPAFDIAEPPATLPQLMVFCPDEHADRVVVVDKRRGRVVRSLPTGASPTSVALDPGTSRLYVALAGEDTVSKIDVIGGAPMDRLQLRPGDRPRELALTPDRRQLLVSNSGSASVAFLDPSTLLELGRVTVGEEPSALLIDRFGRRAYVVNVRSNSVSVIDVTNRAVVLTIATDAEPRRVQLDRAGSRLYVVHAGSPNLLVASLPDLRSVRRQYIGLGASTVRVDSRTDLIYVGRDDAPRVDVYDPISLSPVDSFDVPAPVAYMTIDDVEAALVVAMPTAGSVGEIDLAGRRLRSVVDVGDAPRWVVLAGERP